MNFNFDIYTDIPFQSLQYYNLPHFWSPGTQIKSRVTCVCHRKVTIQLPAIQTENCHTCDDTFYLRLQERILI